MTRGELLNYLAREAKRYNKGVLPSIVRNNHMNDLTESDRDLLQKDPAVCQRLASAVLVDFINYVASGQCVDYGMYTKDLVQER